MPDPMPVWLVVAIGGLGGWISAFGGAWKDAPKEGFQIFKFFRSPIIASLFALALSYLSDDLVLVTLAATGFCVATTETYKTFFFPSVPRGKFAGMPVHFPDMLRKRQPFILLYAAIWRWCWWHWWWRCGGCRRRRSRVGLSRMRTEARRARSTRSHPRFTTKARRISRVP